MIMSTSSVPNGISRSSSQYNPKNVTPVWPPKVSLASKFTCTILRQNSIQTNFSIGLQRLWNVTVDKWIQECLGFGIFWEFNL